MLDASRPEDVLNIALSAFENGTGYTAALDRLPVPIYSTDAEGRVTYWNQACVDFAGREPQLGHDRWCVTWQLFTTSGEALPHAECPMAKALQKRRPIRNEVAIALRPDGSRAAFRAYPTPLFDDEGGLTGAVNMLVDISAEQAGALTDQAARCRRLARATNDRSASDILRAMASGYERTADALRKDD